MVLLGFAIVVSAAAWLVVDEAASGRVASDAGGYLAGFAALWIVAHVVVRRLAPRADPMILPVCALLNGLGIAMIHRIDVAQHVAYGAAASTDAPRQLLWTVVAVITFAGVLLAVRDHRELARYAYTMGLIGIGLLALPAVLPARISEINGAKLWLRVGGFSIQPGEFAKITLTIFFAAYIVAKRDLFAAAGRRILGLRLPRGRDMGPLLSAWGISVLILVSQKDLGMAVLLFGVFLCCLYVATERPSWLIIGGVMFGAVGVIAYHLLPHVHTRIAVWLDPFAYTDAGYQMRQSLFSQGTGGIFGTGLGAGHPELVPLARTDFIVAAFGEELGLFGVCAILVLFAVLVSRFLRIAHRAGNGFGKLLASGLAFTLGLQTFVIVAGVSNLLPETGLATPLLSYGGSALVANLAVVALLLRISDASETNTIAAPAEMTRRD